MSRLFRRLTQRRPPLLLAFPPLRQALLKSISLGPPPRIMWELPAICWNVALVQAAHPSPRSQLRAEPRSVTPVSHHLLLMGIGFAPLTLREISAAIPTSRLLLRQRPSITLRPPLASFNRATRLPIPRHLPFPCHSPKRKLLETWTSSSSVGMTVPPRLLRWATLQAMCMCSQWGPRNSPERSHNPSITRKTFTLREPAPMWSTLNLVPQPFPLTFASWNTVAWTRTVH